MVKELQFCETDFLGFRPVFLEEWIVLCASMPCLRMCVCKGEVCSPRRDKESVPSETELLS